MMKKLRIKNTFLYKFFFTSEYEDPQPKIIKQDLGYEVTPELIDYMKTFDVEIEVEEEIVIYDDTPIELIYITSFIMFGIGVLGLIALGSWL